MTSTTGPRPTHRRRRGVVAGLVAVLSALTLLVGVSDVSAAPDPDPVKPAAQFLGACLQSASTLSVLVVLDKSGSLTGSDPTGVRYQGLDTLLSQLARVTRPNGDPINVEAAVSAFDDRYIPSPSVVGWTKVNQDPSMRRQLIDKMIGSAKRGSSAVNGGGTNFLAALQGGLDDLADRDGPGTCRVLVWFTDGVFTSAPNGVEAARAAMCAPGGLLDSIRRQHIVIIGLQLGTDTSDLKPMSLGQADGRVCGTIPPAEGNAPGVYLNAADASALASLFGSLDPIIQGCTPAGTSGKIDPGIGRMILTSAVSSRVDTVRLQPPDGPAFDAPAQGGATSPSGYVTQGSSDDRQLSIEVTFPSGKGAGQWGVGTTQATAINYCVFSDLTIRIDPNQNVPATPGAGVSFHVVDRSGASADLSRYAVAAPAAAVTGPDKNPRVAKAAVGPQGQLTITFDAEPTDARVDGTASLFVKTVSGLELTPVKQVWAQALTLSDNYPIVTPRDRFELGTAVKRNPVQRDLTLVGSPKGPTKVCFGDVADVRVPKVASGTKPDYPSGCVDLATSETKHVTVRVTPLAATTGDGSAGMPVTLVPVATAGTGNANFTLPVSWRFDDPYNPWVAIITIALITLASILVPFVAIGLANWISARYEVSELRHAVVEVVVSDSGIRRSTLDEDGQPIPLVSTLELDVVPLLGHKPRRTFTVEPVTFRSRARATPASVPAYWAEAPSGFALKGTTSGSSDSVDGSRVSVPPGLGLVGLLVCALDDLRSDQKSFGGRLVVLVRDSSLDGPEISRRLATLSVEQLRRDLMAQGPTSGDTTNAVDDPFGGDHSSSDPSPTPVRQQLFED